MKKKLKIIFIIILVISVLLKVTGSYAITKAQQNVNEKQFFDISKLEVTKNEKIEMSINLDAIKYNKFKFELQASEDIDNIEISKYNKLISEKNNNEIVMEISKESTNLNTINLYYKIPENKKVGDSIKFVAKITNIIKENNKTTNTILEENKKSSNIIANEIKNVNKKENIVTNEIITNITEKEETKSIEFEVKIIAQNMNDNKIDETVQNTIIDKKQEEELTNKDKNTPNIIKNNMTQNMQINSMQFSGNNMMSGNNQVVKVKYNGSDNNYLKELLVEGCTLNKEFSKENSTYFMDISNETEKLKIVATTEEDKATISIYGNENLKEGINKILICVTAENGNVRNYRIFVTKNV